MNIKESILKHTLKLLEKLLNINRYYLLHKRCPKCGSTEYLTTLMATIFNIEEPERYKDNNTCTCIMCGDKHYTHLRKPLYLILCPMGSFARDCCEYTTNDNLPGIPTDMMWDFLGCRNCPMTTILTRTFNILLNSDIDEPRFECGLGQIIAKGLRTRSNHTQFHPILYKLLSRIGFPWIDIQSSNSALITIRMYEDSNSFNSDGYLKPCKYHIFIRANENSYLYHIIGPGGNTLKSCINIDMNMDLFVLLIVKIHNDSEYDWSK